MKILAVADVPHPALYAHFDAKRWQGIDLLLACGDLKWDYLDFLATSLGVPLIYVKGNHDPDTRSGFSAVGEDINGRVVRYKGVRIAGFEGSAWYGGRGLEYTETEMRLLVWRTIPRLLISGGADIVISHAPPVLKREEAPAVEFSESVVDVVLSQPRTYTPEDDGPTDHAHRGFYAYNRLIQFFHPRLWLHGHTHLNYSRAPRLRRLHGTLVANAFGYFVFEI
ncbi:MAG: hypothetical protein M0Z94_06075 [Dehalococcoidales bacterium]|nr:hypothetical protein [Dehalococcoidales bacterium]